MAARTFAFAAFFCIAQASASASCGGQRRGGSSTYWCTSAAPSRPSRRLATSTCLSTSGASGGVSAWADDAAVPAVSVAQSGGTLTIGHQGCVIGNSHYREPEVPICGASFVSEVQATSSAGFEFEDHANVSSLTLTAESSGKIQFFSVTASTVTAQATSSGKIDLEVSHIDQCIFTTQSSGKIEFGTCNTLEVDASSSSKVEVTLTRSATGTVSSSAELEVIGPGSVSGVMTSSGGRAKVYN